MRKTTLFWMMVLGFLAMVTTASPSLGAYSSHQNDTDVSSFLSLYPFARSTKLDDCALCHPGSPNGKSGSCDYCHQTYGLKAPHGAVPLNSYGNAYNTAGRASASIQAIQNLDSDGDGKTNLEEIQGLTFPGDPKDYLGLVPAPAVGLNMERILKLPGYSEFLLLNASKSQDFYATYRGVKVKDLLKYVGARKEATHITVFSPDGFSQKFPIGAPTSPQDLPYSVKGSYPYGTYHGALNFTDYSFIPNRLKNGDRVPNRLHMLLAYMRDGDPLTPGKINPTTLKLDGEGPYRLIPPQMSAGNPDRPSTATSVGDGWDYGASNDHNAGFSARTVAAIRVEPLPSGTTDFNWYEGGWNLVDKGKLVIYGAIDPRTYPVGGKVLDGSGNSVPDVKIVFSLLSLGNVGEAATPPAGGRAAREKFQIDLPAGEYTVVPSKEGCTFTPASLLISLPDSANPHSQYQVNITASCQ